jgi:hypothetical protein
MTVIVSDPKNIGPIWPLEAEIRARIGAEKLTAGDVVFINANGKIAKASAAVAETAKFRGMCLQTSGAQINDVLIRGEVGGLNISALAYDAPVYLSDTPGKLDDAPGTIPVVVGYVVPMSDKDFTKVLRLNGYSG